jgi:hypothetical protein
MIDATLANREAVPCTVTNELSALLISFKISSREKEKNLKVEKSQKLAN